MLAFTNVIDFWRAAGPAKWFVKDLTFDQEIITRFGDLPDEIAEGCHQDWQESALGLLALILALDQFPRNIFRGTAKSFAFDGHALGLARRVIDQGLDDEIDVPLKQFFYLPFMHSEVLEDQKLCLTLYRKINDEQGLDFAQQHFDIIERFGRFPHRNDILGRSSSEDEVLFLQSEHGGF